MEEATVGGDELLETQYMQHISDGNGKNGSVSVSVGVGRCRSPFCSALLETDRAGDLSELEQPEVGRGATPQE